MRLWDPHRGFNPHLKQHAMLMLFMMFRFFAVCAGRRGGKTKGGAHAFALRMTDDLGDRLLCQGRFAHLKAPTWRGWIGSDAEPLLLYWVVAPTYRLLDYPKTELQKVLGLAAEGGLILAQDRSAGVWLLRGGIKIEFRTAERPDLLVGSGLAGLWLEEAARLKSRAWHDALLGTVADLTGWVLFTTTPLGRNWFWRDVWCLGDPDEAQLASGDGGEEVKPDPAYGAIRWWTEENTAVPGLAVEAEAMRARLPDALWRRNFRAAFDAFIGQCFDLQAERHLLRGRQAAALTPASFDRIVAGYDEGRAHPGVLTAWGISGVHGFVELETVSRTRTPITDKGGDGWVDIAQDMRRRWPFEAIWCPTDAYQAEEQFRQHGISTETAFQDRLAGVQWFSTALHNAEARLTSAHVFHRFESLRHPENRTGREAELWVKEDDDEFDASRYALSDWISEGKMEATRTLRLITNPLRR